MYVFREAAYIMNLYLDPEYNGQWEFDPPFILNENPKTIVELGSGIGAVAEKLAKTVVRPEFDILYVTDLPDVCHLLEQSLADCIETSRSSVHIIPLSWGNEEHSRGLAAHLTTGTRSPMRLTHIVCSDLVSCQ